MHNTAHLTRVEPCIYRYDGKRVTSYAVRIWDRGEERYLGAVRSVEAARHLRDTAERVNQADAAVCRRGGSWVERGARRSRA